MGWLGHRSSPEASKVHKRLLRTYQRQATRRHLSLVDGTFGEIIIPSVDIPRRGARAVFFQRSPPSSHASTAPLTPYGLLGTASALPPRLWHLSPCLGAALATSPWLGNLMRLGQRQGISISFDKDEDAASCSKDMILSHELEQASFLANNLFFQMIRESPIHVIRNKSMPASYLSPAMIAFFSSYSLHISQHQPQSVAKDILQRDFGIRSNYIHDQKTGVSMARWMDLMGTQTKQPSSIPDNNGSIQQVLVSSLWLVALWGTATSRQDLNKYIQALYQYDNRREKRTTSIPYHNNGAYHNNGVFVESDFAPEKLESALDQLIHYYNQPCTPHDYNHTVENIIDNKSTETSTSMELICAHIALQHQPVATILPPILPNGYYNFDNGENKADCVEVTIREIFYLLLWDESEGKLDMSRLPDTASQQLKHLLMAESDHLPQQVCDNNIDFGKEWFDLLSHRGQCRYLARSPNGKMYELAPTLENISLVMWSLLIGEDNACSRKNRHWHSLDELAHYWTECNPQYKLLVEFDVLKHVGSSNASSGSIIEHEIAHLQLCGSSRAMEIRLHCDWDEACGMAAVTRLVEPRNEDSLNEEQIRELLEISRTSSSHDVRGSHDSSLAMMCLALRQPQGTTLSPAPSATILQLLDTPYGPDRRVVQLTDVVDEPHGQVHLEELKESGYVLSKAILAACRTCKASPLIGQQLLRWILKESPVVVEKSNLGHSHNPKLHVEHALLSLPLDLLSDDSLLESILENRTIRGKALAMLVLWRLRKATLLDLLLRLRASEWMDLIEMSQLNTQRKNTLS
ncbi:hypothetical protein IV203_004192 [Nitzschia inconspicua]|uniref:Uncharacterized protein n=1 Tax=Nitzschia inconspicua TaxID=303405 RepID=A0A9K3PPX2_9STRA|nr:hypothetical protein IV203_004192 [Nitzschia inconspicua]